MNIGWAHQCLKPLIFEDFLKGILKDCSRDSLMYFGLSRVNVNIYRFLGGFHKDVDFLKKVLKLRFLTSFSNKFLRIIK